MDWVLLALAASFFWSAINVVEKLISKAIKEVFSFGVLACLGETPLIFIFLLFPVAIPDLPILILLLIGGSLRLISYLPYARALFEDEVTRLVPVWNSAPIFTLALSFLFLSEQTPPDFLIGFVLILSGSVLLSLKGSVRLRSGFYLMLLSTFLYSIQAIILKYASYHIDVPSILFWTACGYLISTTAAFGLQKRRSVISKELKSIPIALLALFVLLGISAVSLFTYSIWLGNSAIVMVIGGFQSVFLLGFGIMFKRQLEEKMDRRALLQKAISIALMIVGLAALYL